MQLAHTLNSLRGLNWDLVQGQLWQNGFAVTSSIISRDELTQLVQWTRGGAGNAHKIHIPTAPGLAWCGSIYKYYNPLHPELSALCGEFYQRLLPLANRWLAQKGFTHSYPVTYAQFRQELAKAGQTLSPVGMFELETGDYVGVHQDLRGPVSFPYQVVIMLSDTLDYEGGELTLSGGAREIVRPRFEVGQAVIFPNASDHLGSQVFHSVSRVTRGQRRTLGIILHDFLPNQA